MDTCADLARFEYMGTLDLIDTQQSISEPEV